MHLALSVGISPEGFGVDPSSAGIPSDDDLYRLLAELVDKGALKWLGKAFQGSERPTSVDIACVWLFKPKTEKASMNWAEGNFEADTEDVAAPKAEVTALASPGEIKALVARYKESVRLLEARAQVSAQLDATLKDVATFYEDREHCSAAKLEPKYPYLREYEMLRKMYWETVFKMTKLGSRLGSEEQRDFRDFAVRQANLQFSERNIAEMVQLLFADVEGVMHQLIVRVFDQMTGYHEDNKRHAKGWKTNAPAKIKNRRVILPRGVYFDTWGFQVGAESFLSDLDKALCWVSEISHDDLTQAKMTTIQVLEAHCREHRHYSGNVPASYSDKIYSRFFEMRMYKAGTLHLHFRDPDVCKDFALKASDGRRWIAEQDPATA